MAPDDTAPALLVTGVGADLAPAGRGRQLERDVRPRTRSRLRRMRLHGRQSGRESSDRHVGTLADVRTGEDRLRPRGSDCGVFARIECGIQTPDARAERRTYKAKVEKFGINAMVLLPLVARDAVIGAVVTDSASGLGSLPDHEIALALAICDQAALAVQNALEKKRVPTRVQSALPMSSACEPYIMRRAERHVEKGRVEIFAVGPGNPVDPNATAAG